MRRRAVAATVLTLEAQHYDGLHDVGWLERHDWPGLLASAKMVAERHPADSEDGGSLRWH